jgi:hypothetical protein
MSMIRGAFADDQLGLMNHLGIREFFLWVTALAAASLLSLWSAPQTPL